MHSTKAQFRQDYEELCRSEEALHHPENIYKYRQAHAIRSFAIEMTLRYRDEDFVPDAVWDHLYELATIEPQPE